MKKQSLIYQIIAILSALTLTIAGCSPQAQELPEISATQAQPAVPADTAVPTVTDTPVPDGPCDNPLVPLGANHTWEYLVTNDKGYSSATIKVLGRRDSANIITMVEYSVPRILATREEPVVCLNGGIESFPLIMDEMVFMGYFNQILDSMHGTGYYAPPYTDLAASAWSMDWQVDYLIEEQAELKNPMGDSDLVILASTPVELSFDATGIREPVTTPAGEFPQALKVVHDFSFVVSLTIQGGYTTGTLKTKVNQWYEPYVGLVRAEVVSVVLDTGFIDMPIPFISTVELNKFTP